MSKKKTSKTYYVLESRTHKSPYYMPNRIGHVIGVFSTVGLAEKWIKQEGRTFFGPRFPKKTFWAIVEFRLNDAWENFGSLYSFYGPYGEKF